MIYSGEAVAIGILVSLIAWEVTHLSPGGLVVPAYAALYVHQPERLIALLICALLAYAGFRVVERYALVYGRRRFAVMILLGLAARVVLSRLALIFPWPIFGGQLDVLGYVLPGLLANDFNQQGVLPTLAVSILATALTYGILRLLQVFNFVSPVTLGG